MGRGGNVGDAKEGEGAAGTLEDTARSRWLYLIIWSPLKHGKTQNPRIGGCTG